MLWCMCVFIRRLLLAWCWLMGTLLCTHSRSSRKPLTRGHTPQGSMTRDDSMTPIACCGRGPAARQPAPPPPPSSESPGARKLRPLSTPRLTIHNPVPSPQVLHSITLHAHFRVGMTRWDGGAELGKGQGRVAVASRNPQHQNVIIHSSGVDPGRACTRCTAGRLNIPQSRPTRPRPCPS